MYTKKIIPEKSGLSNRLYVRFFLLWAGLLRCVVKVDWAVADV